MNRPLRVGVDCTPLLGPPTGIHQVTRGLIEALITLAADRTDLEVTGWVLSARGGRPEVDVPVRRSRLPAGLTHRLWSRVPVPGATMVAGRVDVVHATNFVGPPGPRTLLSVQDLSLIRHPEWCRAEVAAMAAPLRAALRRGASVHVSSAAVGRDVAEELGVQPERIHLVHHAVGAVGPGDPARVRRVTGGAPFVLVLGTVETRKRVGSVVRALPSLPTDVRVVLAGPPGNDEPAVTAAATAFGDRVVRLPCVDRATRDALLREATALCYPSVYEGFGLPPLEALSVGTPVVATAVGALPELIGDRVALLPPGDDDALAAALAEAVSHPAPVPVELTARVAELRWDRAADEMRTAYRAVADQAGGDPAVR